MNWEISLSPTSGPTLKECKTQPVFDTQPNTGGKKAGLNNSAEAQSNTGAKTICGGDGMTIGSVDPPFLDAKLQETGAREVVTIDPPIPLIPIA